GLGTLEIDGSVFDVQTGSTISPDSLVLTDGIFLVNGGAVSIGALTQVDSIAQLQLVSGSFSSASGLSNSGTVDVQSANFTITGSAYNQLGGTTMLSGGTIDVTGVGMNLNGGVLQGSGSILGNVNNNAATVTIGTSPGVIAITGDYIQGPAGVLNLEISDNFDADGNLFEAGEDFDLLTATNNIALDGTVNISNLGGYTGNAGDMFVLMTCSGGPTCLSGTFAVENLPGALSSSVFYNAMDFTFAYNSNINNWISTSGLWNNAVNWSLGVVPLSTHEVIISVGGGETITLDAMGLTANTLVSDETLAITAGDLTLNSTTTLNNTLALQGGELTGAGDITVNGLTDWSAGTLSVTGNFSPVGGVAISGPGTKVLDGTILNVSSQSIGGSGIFNIQSGVFTNTGSLAITSDATLQLSGGTLTSTTGFNNDGTFDIDASNYTISASGVHTGSFDVAAGSILTFAATEQTLAGSVFNGNGSVVNQGVLNLDDVIFNLDLVNEGTLNPGASPGTTIVNGDLTLTSSSVLNIEIAGLTAGTQFDFINVEGTAILDGALNLIVLNPFAPDTGDTFEFLQASNVTGNFSTTNLPTGFTVEVNPSSVQAAFESIQDNDEIQTQVDEYSEFNFDQIIVLNLIQEESNDFPGDLYADLIFRVTPQDDDGSGAELICR
ncbi:MAG: hypothetical protein HKN08_12090, partial [Gammaproteobacteria bacterium]|nr:hypothetical protein [Gammaproteobacteria bacterium]